MRDAIVDLGSKVGSRAHGALLRASGWRVAAKFKGMTTVQLHATGRLSGQRRTVVLTTPIHDERSLVLVASKVGDDRNPEWFKNVQANPHIEITIAGVTQPYRARVATQEERRALWPQVVGAYAGYAEYQARTHREIPLVLCTRAASVRD